MNRETYRMKSDWIFLDLDGTLLRTDKSVSAFTVQTLEAVASLGHRIVFSTARPPRSVRRLLPPQFHGFWFLCGNGARVTHQGRVVRETCIAPELVETLVDRLIHDFPGTRYAFEANDTLTANGDFSDYSPADAFTTVKDLRAPDAPVNKVLICLEAGVDAARLKAAIPSELSVVVTDAGMLFQVMAPGISKGQAIRELVTAEGGSGTTLCFGDDLNDVSMFEACTWPVALANSLAPLKALAKAETVSNDEDGVARYLAARYLQGSL